MPLNKLFRNRPISFTIRPGPDYVFLLNRGRGWGQIERDIKKPLVTLAPEYVNVFLVTKGKLGVTVPDNKLF